MGENIGMCARAMWNCGLANLRLVAPRDGWPSEAARATSSGAVDVIDAARVYDTLAEAVADCSFVVATTARGRDMLKPIVTPEEAAAAIHAADDKAGQSTSAIVFGPERTGLENDAITCCDVVLNVPLNPDYSSLNIAQAVLLVSYQWYRQKSTSAVSAELGNMLRLETGDMAPKENLEAFLAFIESSLDESGFFPTVEQRGAMLVNLRNTFQRMRLTKQEVNTLFGAIKAIKKPRN
jgi:tRNA/rRNA methyltransferase